MELTIFMMILLFAIVLSNILDSAFPTFPLPLVQIGLGVIIALTPLDIKIVLQPEIFMGILIAPLLYREAEEADILSMWKVRREVVFLVFGLVFATVLIIGFSVNYFVAAIPLAAALCLGGILGPTDAVAVKSVSNRIDIDENDMNILKGESLINDASGVIAFSFAAIALTTGTFSVAKMSLSFVLLCVGGLAIGLLVVTLKSIIVRSLRHIQIQNTAAFMIMELLVPFICFFLAEAIGVSGIIAAVTAGIRQALLLRRVEIFEARFAVTKKALWGMISVVFNSFVFILLGLELPRIISSVYDDGNSQVVFAMLIGLLATGIMFAIRFIGVTIGVRESHIKNRNDRIRNRIVLTLSGVKGTVSLATAFALPLTLAGGQAFKERDLLLLITASAIIYSLVTAVVLLPLVARARKHERKNKGSIAVLKESIIRLQNLDENYNATVLMRLKRRMLELELEDYGEKEMVRYNRVRSIVFNTEMKVLEQKYKKGGYTAEEYAAYIRVLMLFGEVYNDSVLNRYHNRLIAVIKLAGLKVSHQPNPGLERITEIFRENTNTVKEILDKRFKSEDKRMLSRVIRDRIDSAETVIKQTGSGELQKSYDMDYYRELKESYEVEREVIADFLKDGKLSEIEADDLRVQINTLENFTIEEMQDDAAQKMRSGRRRNIRKRINHERNE